ncbi:MAG: DUF2339 domain-containing protein [Proteobacteria bacterium]|nr:DUF2339 domain-containing protein [Pseudomonadota bacterium]MBS0573137.1 DUF2339 domain-containing protein [Pseudomonadota bacterium]
MDGWEFLALVAGLAVVAVPVVVIALAVAVVRLRRRMEALERHVARVTATERAGVPPQPVPVAEPVQPVPVAAAEPPPIPETAGGSGVDSGPWTGAAIPEPVQAAAEGPMVLTAARASALGDWLKANWIYAVSALSLAFAGVFFVQYGVENGLLPPPLRVLMALLFGAALVGAGEAIRRRQGGGTGDGAGVATAYLPSTFAGAGLVSMFAGLLAARQLYDLIGVEAAFAGLLAVAALAVGLGWFYGPFLAAAGLIGAGAAPFVVGGSSDSAQWLYGYFALIAGAGLAVDAVRRWAWVSVLALAMGYGGAGLVLAASGGAGWCALFLAGMAALAVLVPCLRLAPDQAGPTVAEALIARGRIGWPVFPVRLAAGAVALSALGLALIGGESAANDLLALLAAAGLAAALILWSRGAPGLSDLAALPALAYLARLAAEGLDGWPLAAEYAARAITLRAPETSAPGTAALILALAAGLTLLAAWRSDGPDHRAPWAAGAALIAPLAAVALELFWAPSAVIGAYPWALHVLVLAALMTALALRFARADAGDMRRAAYVTLSALALIALALCLVLTKGALTLALAALILAAAALDRRFRLPEMGLFVQAAVVGVSYRLVIDPGLGWAVDAAARWEVAASYGGAAAAMLAALWLLGDLPRKGARVFLESGGTASAALLVNVALTRWLNGGEGGLWMLTHWAASLNAMPWLILMLVQLHRLGLGGALNWLRIAIAAVAGLLALAGIGMAVGPFSPLVDSVGTAERLVYGPPVLDTLLVAYGLPALLVLAAAAWMGHLPRWLLWALRGAGCALAALYGGLEIRRFWQGDDLSGPGVVQGELYCYTVALMVLGAALLYQAIARGSADLRRGAMVVIGLTVAKVFLLDASGLSGLTRVASFVGLGLALAGLAWLNRWAAGRQGAE